LGEYYSISLPLMVISLSFAKPGIVEVSYGIRLTVPIVYLKGESAARRSGKEIRRLCSVDRSILRTGRLGGIVELSLVNLAFERSETGKTGVSR